MHNSEGFDAALHLLFTDKREKKIANYPRNDVTYEE